MGTLGQDLSPLVVTGLAAAFIRSERTSTRLEGGSTLASPRTIEKFDCIIY